MQTSMIMTQWVNMLSNKMGEVGGGGEQNSPVSQCGSQTGLQCESLSNLVKISIIWESDKHAKSNDTFAFRKWRLFELSPASESLCRLQWFKRKQQQQNVFLIKIIQHHVLERRSFNELATFYDFKRHLKIHLFTGLLIEFRNQSSITLFFFHFLPLGVQPALVVSQ